MAGFQFVHIESYGRKADKGGRSVGFVLDEAERLPGACGHVEAPGTPVVVHGLSLAQLRARHDDQVVDAKTVTKAGQTKKVRSDQHTLLTIVASHPISSEEARADPIKLAEVDAWQARTLDWMCEEWGDRLVSVICHDDESYPHLHAYVLPDDPAMTARLLHPGAVAKAAVQAAGIAAGETPKVANRLGDDAYKAAMRHLQDRFFERVGVESGMTRIGPGRRRMTRAEWQADQVQATAARTAIAMAKAARLDAVESLGDAVRAQHASEARAAALAVEGAAYVARAKAAAAAALAQADKAKAEAIAVRRDAAVVLRDAKVEARRTVEAAGAQAERLRTWGARLGGLWGGLAGVQRRFEARAADQVQAAQAAAAEQVEKAKVAIRAEVVGKLAGKLAGLERDASAGVGAVAALKGARAELAKAQRLLELERVRHASTSREREAYRERWATADNALQARGHTRKR